MSVANFGCTYGRSKVAFCFSAAITYYPLHFFSRYPQEATKLWNLKNLLTPTSWFAYYITITTVTICFKLFSYIGRKLGLNTVTEEIPLVPFRFLKYRVFKNVVSIYLFRISVTKQNHQSTNHIFPQGFSSNFIYITWALFGGIMMYLLYFL